MRRSSFGHKFYILPNCSASHQGDDDDNDDDDDDDQVALDDYHNSVPERYRSVFFLHNRVYMPKKLFYCFWRSIS